MRAGGAWVPIAMLAGWQALSSAGVLTYDYLPAPTEIATALLALAQSGALADAAGHTLTVALAAALIAIVAGGSAGLAVGLSPVLSGHVLASVDVLRTVPAVALVPVAVLTLGPTITAELAVAVYAGLWPVLISTAAGVAAVPAGHHDAARTLRLRRSQVVRKVVVPAAVPAWLVGARMSAVVALLVAIVAEMLTTPRGLGGALVESLNALAPQQMWAYVAVCGAIGFLLNATLRRLGRAAFPAIPLTTGRDVGVLTEPGLSAPQSAVRGLVPLAALLLAWQVAAPPQSLFWPPPSEWLRALTGLVDAGALLPAAAETVSTYVVGLAAAALCGGLAGVAVGWSRRADRALTPTLDFLAAVPAAALVPVVVLLLGPGRVAGVVLVAVVVSWPVLLSTATATRGVPTVRREMARTLGLSPLGRWLRVVLPSITPGGLLGLRLASGLALIVTLLADIFGAGGGIGRLLVISQQQFDAAAAWGLVSVVGAFGYLSSAVIGLIGRRALARRGVVDALSR
ncbi:ABC transporter permease subunit [Mycobacterium sp. PS03-16]|uniref:ABC transporter permease n=1 Tax=Mycobacterium sp. PS03-16 TaxID=2559611 RepID=UPI001074282D|nr:ABC transporter permease subunit [Mycobacterium sp. PS03-16]TFV58895.1 ABC transporter permease subunit [Mycobacterium sp. PS03-16]